MSFAHKNEKVVIYLSNPLVEDEGYLLNHFCPKPQSYTQLISQATGDVQNKFRS